MRCLKQQNPSVALRSIHQCRVQLTGSEQCITSVQLDQSHNIIIMKWRMGGVGGGGGTSLQDDG